MAIREQFQQNPTVAIVAAVIVIIGSGLWVMGGSGGKRVLPNHVYYYDLQTGELFTADRAARPPIDAPSGAGNGVKASVYSCGSCNNDDIQIAFITTFNEQARAAMEKMADASDDSTASGLSNVMEQGMLVAAPPEAGAEPRWVPAMTPQGVAITGGTNKLCDGEPARPCMP